MIHTIIVEDDPMVAQINQQYLLCFNNFVVDGIFANGQAALDYLHSHLVDLMILDVYMPSLSGNELLRRMRSENSKCAVIMITAATEMSIVNETLHLGIVDYLIKPYTFERFQEAIHKYLSQAHLLKSTTKADQSVVDRLLNNDASSNMEYSDLRKGLTQKTLDYIYSLLHENEIEKHTCESIAAASGLSKITVRRYFNYLIETGHLLSSIDYETGGRPRVLYRLK